MDSVVISVKGEDLHKKHLKLRVKIHLVDLMILTLTNLETWVLLVRSKNKDLKNRNDGVIIFNDSFNFFNDFVKFYK